MFGYGYGGLYGNIEVKSNSSAEPLSSSTFLQRVHQFIEVSCDMKAKYFSCAQERKMDGPHHAGGSKHDDRMVYGGYNVMVFRK